MAPEGQDQAKLLHLWGLTLRSVPHSPWDICDIEISRGHMSKVLVVTQMHTGTTAGLVAGVGSPFPCCRSEKGSLGHASMQI